MKKTTALIASVVLASGSALAGDDIKDKDFTEVDANDDGVVARSEILTNQNDVVLAELFAQVDVDRNGYLTPQEYQDLQMHLQRQEEEAEE